MTDSGRLQVEKEMPPSGCGAQLWSCLLAVVLLERLHLPPNMAIWIPSLGNEYLQLGMSDETARKVTTQGEIFVA